MKRKEFTELKGKDIKVLLKMAFEKKAESLKIKIGMSSGKEKNLKVLKNLKREIAQILTLIREKEILAKLEPKETTK